MHGHPGSGGGEFKGHRAADAAGRPRHQRCTTSQISVYNQVAHGAGPLAASGSR